MFSRRTSMAVASLLGFVLGLGPDWSARAQATKTGGALPTSGPLARLTASRLQETLAAQRGKVVLLHLWATWCAPCVRELPMMSRLAARLRKEDVVVVSLSLDPPGAGTAARVQRLLDTRGKGLTRAIADLGDDADAFVEAIDPRWPGTIPALFGYDHAGRLGGALFGEATEDEIATLVAELRRKPSVAAPAPTPWP